MRSTKGWPHLAGGFSVELQPDAVDSFLHKTAPKHDVHGLDQSNPDTALSAKYGLFQYNRYR